MDQATMCSMERWIEIAETMTIEARFTEGEASAANIEASVSDVDPGKPDDPDAIEEQPREPRTARVLSIAELRQKLGLEQRAPAAPPPKTGRPRIVRRREAVSHLASG